MSIHLNLTPSLKQQKRKIQTTTTHQDETDN